MGKDICWKDCFKHVGVSLCRNVLFILFFCLFQRATLAEKEVTSLKEQLASSNSTNQNLNDLKDNAIGMDRTNFEVELQAKDKEVCSCLISNFREN